MFYWIGQCWYVLLPGLAAVNQGLDKAMADVAVLVHSRY